jgi:CheY-like chemotaxis protein/HPt (histidine-containing phosphotransfer) domain-containing protein
MTEQSKSVLVAEDNLVNQKLATLMLEQLGLTVDVVDSGRKAVQAVEQKVYAVVLMDCQMPEMDGFDATKAIRKLESLRGTYTPIIAVTALAMVGDRERCMAVGMDDYISKPIDRHMLKIKLNHWTQREFVQRNQELSRKYAQLPNQMLGGDDPIDLGELEEFYANDLDDVLTTFIESTDKLLRDINQSIIGRSDTALANMAHELKGSSASVGAKGLAKLAMYLERAAGIRDWTEAKDTFSALNNSFAQVREFLTERRLRLSTEGAVLPTIETKSV